MLKGDFCVCRVSILEVIQLRSECGADMPEIRGFCLME